MWRKEVKAIKVDLGMKVVINYKLGNTGSNIVQTNTENIAGKVYNGLELKTVSMFTWKKNTTMSLRASN